MPLFIGKNNIFIKLFGYTNTIRMVKSILLTAATELELSSSKMINISGLSLDFLVTGIGGVSTAWSLMNYLALNPAPDIILNIGIAGSFRKNIPIGSVVISSRDRFGDMGIDDNGTFTDLFEAGLQDTDAAPFKKGFVYADSKLVAIASELWLTVDGVTVSKTSGSTESVALVVEKYNPDIETMEVAAFYYVCSRQKIAALSLRSISNMMGPRDRSEWDIQGAISQLGPATEKLIGKICGL